MVPADLGLTRSELAERLLEALPFGLSVHAEDGRCLLANATAHALEGDAARETETRTVPIAVAGQSLSLRTVTDVTAQRRAERDLFDRAYLDALTGLPNRNLAEQTVEQLIATTPVGGHFALAFIDLDNFKEINDHYGAALGDALLVAVTERLTRLLPSDDVLARVGGDEFALVVTSFVGPPHLQHRLDEIAARLQQPFMLEGHELFASASIGASVFPDHGRSYDTLRRTADGALTRAKSGIKGRARLYDEAMRHSATARMAVEQRLRFALRDNRLCCAFQPKVNIRTNDIEGAEVLLRWRDEHGQVHGPGDFVGLACELGLIDDIANVVLSETTRQLDAVDAVFGPGTPVSVNVAAKQAENVDFMTCFTERLAATGCPERFVVEVTEEAFYTKSRFQRDVMPGLHRIGTRVAIDDFGVGYSSLAALAELTADEVKIDRALVADIHVRPRGQCVLQAIDTLARSLGMSVIAEGVESNDELAYLQAATQIDIVQGYVFARPMLIEEMRGTPFPGLGRQRHFIRQAGAPRAGIARTYGATARL